MFLAWWVDFLEEENGKRRRSRTGKGRMDAGTGTEQRCQRAQQGPPERGQRDGVPGLVGTVEIQWQLGGEFSDYQRVTGGVRSGSSSVQLLSGALTMP